MSEKLFRFLLPELTTIVIRCTASVASAKCSGAIEMSSANLRGLNKAISCPVCGASFTFKGTQRPNPLEELGRAIEDVKEQCKRDNFRVEFVVPDPPVTQAD